MGENLQKLEINRDYQSDSNVKDVGNEVLQIEKNIETLQKSISDLESKRETQLCDLADEKNYDLFFYIGGVLVLLNVIFNFNIPGLLIAVAFGGMFFVYRKYFNKEIRATHINAAISKEIDALKGKVEERREEIKKQKTKL